MKKIRIKNLEITNFKGIKSLKIYFETTGSNTIYGANGTGKTTVFDAFTWVLFNKDSQGRTDFEVKQLDNHNNIIHNQETEVEATLLVDDESITVRKVLTEKWTKKRGSDVAEFTGNETVYFFNEVPLSQKEYQFKISNLVDENVFKNITNPLTFVSLKWQDQRKTLVEIANIPSDRQIALGNVELENLFNEIGTQKSIEEFTAQTKHSIKKAKDEIISIPARIEELNRSKPTPIVEKNILAQIESYKEQISKLDDEIANKMKSFDNIAELRNQTQQEILELKSKINEIEFSVKEDAKIKSSSSNPTKIELDRNKQSLLELQESFNSNTRIKDSLNADIKLCSKKRDELRTQWQQVNARTFKLDPNDTNCSTCGQELKNSEDIASQLEYKFNSRKNNEIKEIQTLGASYKARQEENEDKLRTVDVTLSEIQQKISDCNSQIESLEKALKDQPVFNPDKFITETLIANQTYNDYKHQLKTLETKTFNTPSETLNAEQKAKKLEIQSEIEKLQGYLKDNDRIKEINQRIAQLSNEENVQNQIIANFERNLYIVEQFNKKKIDLLDESVNKMFQLVKFKLFDVQINGGVKETCEAMVTGVPFGNVNTASKINAGIDIINTLCNYYKVTAPIFVDNKESVTQLIDTKSQVVSLVVSPTDLELKIN